IAWIRAATSRRPLAGFYLKRRRRFGLHDRVGHTIVASESRAMLELPGRPTSSAYRLARKVSATVWPMSFRPDWLGWTSHVNWFCALAVRHDRVAVVERIVVDDLQDEDVVGSDADRHELVLRHHSSASPAIDGQWAGLATGSAAGTRRGGRKVKAMAT